MPRRERGEVLSHVRKDDNEVPAADSAEDVGPKRSRSPGKVYGGAKSLTKGKKKTALDRPIDQVRNIDPSLIQVSEANARLQALLTEESIAELVESFKEHGQIQPAEVFKLPDSEGADEDAPRYELISGSRRLMAAKQLGEPLRAVVYEPTDWDFDASETALALIARSRAENKREQRPSQYEYAQVIARTMERWPELSQREVAKALELTEGTVSSLLAYSRFPVEAAQLLGEPTVRSLKPQVGARWTRERDTDRLVGLIRRVREEHPEASGARLVALIDQEIQSGDKKKDRKKPAPKWRTLPSGAKLRPDWRKGQLHLEVKLQKDLKDPDRTMEEMSEEVKRLLKSKR